jgi:mannose-6-phosphate isomerase-like protein (cupin superfamily)
MQMKRLAAGFLFIAGSVLAAQTATEPPMQATYASVTDLMARTKADIAAHPDFSATAVKNTPAYRVNVVHRGKPDNALAHKGFHEMHYIMDGSGTLVTGGHLVKTPQGNTIIEGGDERHVQKGDVIIVPDGTPHWYKTIDGSLTYLEGRFIAPSGVLAQQNAK